MLTFEVDTNEMELHEKHINYKEIFEHCNNFLVTKDVDDIPLSIICELQEKNRYPLKIIAYIIANSNVIIDCTNSITDKCFFVRNISKIPDNFTLKEIEENRYTCDTVIEKKKLYTELLNNVNIVFNSYKYDLLPHANIIALMDYLTNNVKGDFTEIIRSNLDVFDNFIERERAFKLLSKYQYSFIEQFVGCTDFFDTLLLNPITPQGIRNPSNYCYAISVFEVFVSLSNFMKTLLNSGSTNQTFIEIKKQFVNLFSKFAKINVDEMINLTCGKHNLRGQIDCSEFFMIMYSDLSCMEPKVRELFNIVYTYYNVHLKKEDLIETCNFDIPIIKNCSLEEAFNDYFIKNRVEIKSSSEYFIISLQYQSTSLLVSLPLYLQLYESSGKYKLKSVIFYKGIMIAGHYCTLTNINENWYFVNDSNVYKFDISTINDCFCSELQPKLLVYAKDEHQFPIQMVNKEINCINNTIPYIQRKFLRNYLILNNNDQSNSYIELAVFGLFSVFNEDYNTIKFILEVLADKVGVDKALLKMFHNHCHFIDKTISIHQSDGLKHVLIEFIVLKCPESIDFYKEIVFLIKNNSINNIELKNALLNNIVDFIYQNRIIYTGFLRDVVYLLSKTENENLEMFHEYLDDNNIEFEGISEEQYNHSSFSTTKVSSSENSKITNVDLIKVLLNVLSKEKEITCTSRKTMTNTLLSSISNDDDFKKKFSFKKIITYATDTHIRVKEKGEEAYFLNLDCKYLFLNDIQMVECQSRDYKTDLENTYIDGISLKLHKIYEYISLQDTNDFLILLSSGCFIPYACFDNNVFVFKSGIIEENKALVVADDDDSITYRDNEINTTLSCDIMVKMNFSVIILTRHSEKPKTPFLFLEPNIPTSYNAITIVYQAYQKAIENIKISNETNIKTVIKRMQDICNNHPFVQFIKNKSKDLGLQNIISIAEGKIPNKDKNGHPFTSNEREIIQKFIDYKVSINDFHIEVIPKLIALIESQLCVINKFALDYNKEWDDILEKCEYTKLSFEHLSKSQLENIKSIVRLIIAVISPTEQLPCKADFDKFSPLQVFCLYSELLDKLKPIKQGKRYPQFIKLMWVQRFLESKKGVEMISRIWNGPKMSTIYRWYDDAKKAIIPVSFKVQNSSIKETLKFWANTLGMNHGLPVIIAIDAMEIQKHVRIKKNGDVEGTLDNMKVSDEQILLYRNDYEAYNDFLNKLDAKGNLIKSVFVILLVPLANYVAPPLQIIFASNGNASAEIVKHIKDCAAEIKNYSNIFKFFGVAFDGDKQYIKLHSDFGCFWCSLYNGELNKFRSFLNNIKPSDLVICDPPHLLKRARYYVVNNENFAISDGMPIKTRTELISDLSGIINIIFLRNSRNTKMDDNYPRVFFRPAVLYSLIIQENWIAVGMFLPATLLNCYFYIKQTRIETLEILTIAFFFVLEVLMAETGLEIKDLYKQGSSKPKNKEIKKDESIKISPILDVQWCREFLNTVLAIMIIFKEIDREFNTEHIGSYLDEHFFAKIRMMSSNFDTYQRFVKVFDKILLSTALKQDINAIRSKAKYRGADIPHGKCSLNEHSIKNCNDISHAIFKKVYNNKCEMTKNENESIGSFKMKLLAMDQLENEMAAKKTLSTDGTSFAPIRNLSVYERYAFNSAKYASIY